jgi:hypothetical protein
MRIAPQLLAKLVTLDLAGRRARQIVGNFEPLSFPKISSCRGFA